MAIKRRKPAVEKEGAIAAPSANSTSRFKKREIANTGILDNPNSELAAIVKKITESGDYGQAFHIANSRKFATPRLETGVLALDLTLGGGLGMGRASMLYGERSAGKSTTGLIAMARLQKQRPDDVVAVIDAEGTFDKGWAKKLGCDLSRIIIAEPESGEHAIDLADAMMRAKEVGMVVTDSIAALIPTKEIDESAMQEFMGLQARLIGKYVRKATQALLSERKRDHLVHCLFLNQFRMKVGLVFGDPRTLPGGKALEFFMSQQAEIKNKEHFGKDASGDNVVMYNEHNIKVTKNKMGGPLREGMFQLIRTEHDGMPEAWVNQAKAVVSSGMKVGLITGAPSSFEIEGVNGKFLGAPALNAWAVENPDAYSAVISSIVASYMKKWGLE
jgi:recombination protein RecA